MTYGVTWGEGDGPAGATGVGGGSGGLPALTLGTINASGTASTFVLTDATILAFDTVLPRAIMAVGLAGSADVAARRDHEHQGTGYAYITDGTNTATATGLGTFKLRSDNSITITVADNAAFQGDNAVFSVVGTGPHVILASATAAGFAADFVRTDDTVRAFDGTVPANITTANTDGTTSFAQRSGHTHRFGILTTAGDVLGFDGTDPVRRAIGTHGQFLSVATGNSDKLSWTTAAAGGGISSTEFFLDFGTREVAFS